MQVSGEALKNQLEVSEKKLTEKEQQYVIQWQKLAFRIANKFIRTCNINPDSFFADHILMQQSQQWFVPLRDSMKVAACVLAPIWEELFMIGSKKN